MSVTLPQTRYGLFTLTSKAFRQTLTKSPSTILQEKIAEQLTPLAQIDKSSTVFENMKPEPGNFLPVIRLIEKQAEKKLHQTCLVYAQQKISFFELNQHANRVARYLQYIGVKKNQYVPVCIDKSIEMMIAMLAIFKTGATYVPLDPAHPADRIEFMLNDLQATLVFTTSITRKSLGAHAGKVIEIFESDSAAIGKQPAENISVSIRPDDVAYVIYTSGSTGRPKGVMVEQAAMYNYMVNSSTKFIHENENLYGSYIHLSNTFDASLTSLFMPMLAGKAAVISSTSGSEAFNDENFLKYAPYDFLNVTPAHLDFLAATVTDPQNWATRRLVIGGEALYTGHFDFFAENNVPLEIINLYGPTEATIGCTTYGFWLSDLKNQSNEIPIGAPIGETTIYLLQQEGDVVKIANTGEICIGGKNLAKGYLNRDELTRDKFIENPIQDSNCPLLYKTGDLGKWLPDGNLAYCGRIDNQVKISGYRIELGEIESVVNLMPFVNNSCVVATGDSDKKLICFVLPQYDKILAEIGATNTGSINAYLPSIEGDSDRVQTWLQSRLNTYLEERLPKYMVPGSFVVVNKFPLSSSGKIDRKALMSVRLPATRNVHPGRLPNSVEGTLIEVWQKVLGVDDVQVADNFFALGGNSVQAARMFNLLRKHLNLQVPISSLLKYPTVEGLATLFTSTVDTTLWDIVVPFRTEGSKPPLFLIHGGAGSVLFYKSLADLLPNDQPVYGIKPRGIDGIEPPINSIKEMARWYIEKIKTIQKTGPYYIGGYCFGASVAVEIASQLQQKGEQVAFLSSINGISPSYLRRQIGVPISFIRESLTRIPKHLKSNVPVIKAVCKEAVFMLKCVKAYIISTTRWKLLPLLSIKFNLPLPAHLAKDYYFVNNSNMGLRHQLIPYAGNLTIFKSPNMFDDDLLGWQEHVIGEIRLHEIPGDHENRMEIFREPFVNDFAKKFAVTLNEAQIEAIA